MKKNIIKGLLALVSISLFFACEDIRFGNGLLNQTPDDTGQTKDTMFSKKYYAMQVLTKAYTSLPYGIPVNNFNQGGDMLLDAISDISFSTMSWGGAQKYYYNGGYSPAININKDLTYSFTKGTSWWGIRYAWIFAENVDRVPDMTQTEKSRAKAEAKIIIALHYTDMFRHFGGLPWIDHAVKVDELHKFPRQTLETTVNNIASLIDEAIPPLEWMVSDKNDDGRMTQAFAMGLKLRLLLMAASPLFNDDAPYMQGKAAEGRYVWYGDKSIARWQRAEKAGADFIEMLAQKGQYDLVQPTENTPAKQAEAFRNGYFLRDNGEVLLSVRKGYTNNYGTEWCGGGNFYANTQTATLNYVNMFPMYDGTDFPADFDWSNVTLDPFANRDVRLQETVLTNDRPFMGRKSQLYIGGLDRLTVNTEGTGFMIYKFAMDRTNATSVGRVDSWPYMRLSEVLLSYAEAINEANGGPNDLAYNMVDKVRNRVGLADLPRDLSPKEFREAVLRERACEFGYEQVRWYDLTRWKRDDIFKAEIKGINLYPDNTKPTKFRYEVFNLRDRAWRINWSPKWYLTGFPTEEVNKNYGLIQNPGWEQ